MRISRIVGGVCGLAVCVLLNSSALAQTAFIKNNADGSQTFLNLVPNAVTKGIFRSLGAASSSQVLDLRVVLPSKDPAGLQSTLKDLYDPQSPKYHQFLNHQQVIQQFGADSVSSALVAEQLKAGNLTVYGQSDDGCLLKVSGAVADVNRAFGVTITNYRGLDGKTYFAPSANPTIPAKLSGKVSSILGLNNMVKYQPHFYSKKPGATAQSHGFMKSSLMSKAVAPAFSGPSGTVAPSDLLTAYNLGTVASNGSGQTQALFELDGFLRSDVTQFTSQFHLTQIPAITVVPVDGGITTIGEGTGEVDLDIDLTIAVAPGLSNILVYEADQLAVANAWIDEWNQIYSEDRAMVISCSWGIDEAQMGSYDHTVFDRMAAQGQAVFASSGDSGAYDNCQEGTLPPSCVNTSGVATTGVLSVDDPASYTYITGVGISIVSVNGSEAWTGETASLQGGGGISGTNSPFYSVAIPSYQTAMAAAANGAAGVSTSFRNVPDVVLTADPATEYWIYITDPQTGTGWYTVWGSSAAAPIWAAFIARVNQGRVAWGGAGNVIGFLNPSIYAIAHSADYAATFHDITTSTNSFYHAEAGLDDATGLGSFNGQGLYNELIGPAAPTVTPSPGNATVVLNWTASSGATSYHVKKATVSGGSYSTINTTASTTYTDNAVVNGTTYYYVVSAINAGSIEGANASQASATPLAPPSSPTGILALPGNTQIDVSWNASATAASYNVKRATVTGGPYSFVANVPGVSYTDNSLTNSTPYFYVIDAVNVGGASSDSAEATSTPDASLPIAPTGVSALAGNTSITLNWIASAGATSYNVKRATATGGPYITISALGTVTGNSYVDNTVANGTTYYYVVSAVNGNGEGADSAEVNAEPLGLLGPSNLQATILGARVGGQIIEGGVVLTWTQAPIVNIVQNRIYRAAGSGSAVLVASINASGTYTDTKMPKGVQYTYTVTAYNSSGFESLASSPLTVNY